MVEDASTRLLRSHPPFTRLERSAVDRSGLLVHEIRRRRIVRWRDWGLFLLAIGLAVAVAVY